MGMIKVDGDLTIQTYNDQSGSSMAVAMPGGVVQQHMYSNPSKNEPEYQSGYDKSDDPLIYLNSAKGSKINLYRVIISMHKLGFFVDKTGRQATQKEVFNAFGEMLGMDFSKYSKDLSEASKKKNEVTIFEELEEAFRGYEEGKELKSSQLR